MQILEFDLNYLLKDGGKRIDNPLGEAATQEEKQRLITSQSAWQKYRDTFCENDRYSAFDKIIPEKKIKFAKCMHRKTIERMDELKARYFYRTEE